MSESSRQPGTDCPSWRELPPDHTAGSGAAGETTHRRVVREIGLGTIEAIREAADAPVRVAVEAYSDPEGGEHPPTVRLTLSGASDAAAFSAPRAILLTVRPVRPRWVFHRVAPSSSTPSGHARRC